METEIGECVFMWARVWGGGGRVKDRCLLCVGMYRSVKKLKWALFSAVLFFLKPTCEGHYLVIISKQIRSVCSHESLKITDFVL